VDKFSALFIRLFKTMSVFFHKLRFVLALPVLTLLGCVPMHAHKSAGSEVSSGAAKVEVVNAAVTPGVNDTLEVVISGEDDLSGSYKVSEAGDITLPLLPAPLHVAGLPLPIVTQAIIDAYKDGYLVDPKVNVTLYVKAGGQ